MTEEERQQFVTAMGNLAAYYSHATEKPIRLSDGVVEMLWDDLKGFELVEVLSAIKRHRRDPQWGHRMPLSSDLIRHLKGRPEARAELGWSKAVEAVRRHGRYCSVVFDDPAVGRVIEDMGGWIRFCDRDLDEWDQKEFVRRYSHFCEVGLKDAPGQLPGMVEAQNRHSGFREDKYPLVLVGDADQARKRLKSGGKYEGRTGARRFLRDLQGGKSED